MIFRDLKTNEWEFSCDVFEITATQTANSKLVGLMSCGL